ncbi:MAG: single-stranded DNA-binding protein [Burkholderiales bacterium]|nr:single-stranded DNA-binding protein [Burkholderiales bacterium]
MKKCSSITESALAAAQKLRATVNTLSFAPPVTHVYNPLDYAWTAHETYLRRFANTTKKIVFVGMNPGPFGMAQTGVPFGEIAAVRDWLGIYAPIQKPTRENPKRPVEGFSCQRSEVSGRRLWGLFAQRFGAPEVFFSDHFVVNYCPLIFFNEARNMTPDKLPLLEQRPLLAACDIHLRALLDLLQPQWTIGVGVWTETRIRHALGDATPIRVGRILHPSPASPIANRGWAQAATQQLRDFGIW